MRILLMNQFFWPDSAATSQLLTDLATGMAERGHEVHVICADGGYAIGSAEQAPPATIHRVKTLPFRRGVLGRLLSYLSFFLGAAWLGLTLPRPDRTVTLTTPPLLALLGSLIKFVRGSQHYVWEMDVYPDVAVSLGYFKPRGLLDRLTGVLADLPRRYADGVIALGECMRTRLAARGICEDRIFVAENWADCSAIQPVVRFGSQESLVLLYSGNLGLAHDVDTIAAAMVELKQSERIRFVFSGSGPRRRQLELFCKQNELSTVTFKPYVERTSLSESLGAGDIGLVTQKASCCGSVVPSKVYGLLAAGRPFLFIGPAEATPARIIRNFGCGWHIECGDTAATVSILEHLAVHPELVRKAGVAARAAAVEHYDRAIGVQHICELMGVFPLHDSAGERFSQVPSLGVPALKQQA